MKASAVLGVLVMAAMTGAGCTCIELLSMPAPISDPCAPDGCSEGGGGQAGATTATGGTGGAGGAGGDGGTGGDGGAMVCMPGETQSCYSGPDRTEGVGECKAGTQTCADEGSGWEPCQGETTPKAEDLSVVGDDGCDGYKGGETICAGAFGGLGKQSAKAVAIDRLTGAVVVAGVFDASAEFGADVLVSVGATDVFLVKLNPDCTEEWAIQFGGQGVDDATSIGIDEMGNVVVAGQTTETIDFSGTVVPGPMYIAKFDGDSGGLVWAAGCAADPAGTINDLALDSGGDIAVAGQFVGSLNCGDGLKPGNAMGDAFLSRFDGGTGMTSWTKVFAGSTAEMAIAVAFDPVGSVLIAGEFSETTNLGGDDIVGADFLLDVFVGKFAANGAHIWSKALGGTGVQRPLAVAADQLGGAVIAGRFSGDLVLPSVGTLTAKGDYDGFVLKVTSTGNPEWGISFGDSGSSAAADVNIDPAGDVLISGVFRGTIDLAGEQLGWAGEFITPDAFAAKLSGLEGAHIWSRTFGDYDEQGPNITVDAQGLASLCASGDKPLDFGYGGVNPEGSDVFLARLAP